MYVAGGNDLAMVAYSQWDRYLDGMEYARFENRSARTASTIGTNGGWSDRTRQRRKGRLKQVRRLAAQSEGSTLVTRCCSTPIAPFNALRLRSLPWHERSIVWLHVTDLDGRRGHCRALTFPPLACGKPPYR